MNTGRVTGWFLTLVVVLAGTRAIAGSPSDLQARATAEIQAQEYELSWQQAWQAPNRAHGFRITFTDAGMRVVPRLEMEPSWEWGLSLLRYGRPSAKVEARAPQGSGPALSAVRNRLDRSSNGITEWYVNDPRGLEHGFTVPERPAGSNAEVHVDLALTGTLHPSFSSDGQAIDFRMPGGPSVLHYGHLEVVDARGRNLPSRMEGFAEAGVRGVRLVFDDGDAVYPVTVDPLATSASWTSESNQASSKFGVSAATAGDVNGDGYSDVLVGAENFDNGQADEGRAFLYLGQPSGLALTAAWTAESNQTAGHFGGSVAAAGDVNGDGFGDVIVGCRDFDNGLTNAGRAYVYLGSAAGLATTAAWIGEGDQESGFFGTVVATAGDVNWDGYADVVIGAPGYDNGQPDEGRAYAYFGSSTGLSSTPGWNAEGNQASSGFGSAVGTAGDVNGDGFAEVIVGAPLLDAAFADNGRAYVYFGSFGGLGFVHGWTATISQANVNFGTSVGTAGDVNGDGYADVVVGAPYWDNGEVDEGRVLVYMGSSGGLATSPAWSDESGQANARMGFSAATAGDVNADGYADLIVGAPLMEDDLADEGRANVYLGSSSGLNGIWTMDTNQANAQFGSVVATAGDVNGDGFSEVLVSAPLADNGQTDEGRVFMFLGGANNLAATANWAKEGGNGALFYGASLASAGDVNGDGYSDVIVGAEDRRAHLYLGSSSGLGAAYVWEGFIQALHSYGTAVASAGDVNGDGYDDFLVGAYSQFHGQAFLYHGSNAGLSSTASWIGTGTGSFDNFGQSLASAGDVNGDGYADVIIGAPTINTRRGAAYVFLGSASGLAATPAWTVEGTLDNAELGGSVASAGDVNRDGYSDVIVGAHKYNNATEGGRAFVYLGSAAGLSTTPVWTATSNEPSGGYGYSVALAGDVNGDGYSDIVVGRWNFNTDLAGGKAFVYLGSASGPSTVASTILAGAQSGEQFGNSVASAGDVNGDGYSDLVVGAPNWGTIGSTEGRTYLYLGSASGLSTTPAWIRIGTGTQAHFGTCVASAGDVNGDGLADLLSSEPRFSAPGLTQEGKVHLYYGNGAAGRPHALQQLRANATALIRMLGRSESSTSFRVSGWGWNPAGRSRVRLQWEAKPFATAFNGAGLRLGSVLDTNVPGANGSQGYLSELADQLTAGTLYHWRARVVGDSPFFPRSRWMSPAGNNSTEADLRTSSCVDLDGDGYGSNGDATCPLGPQFDCNDANSAIRPGALEVCDGVDNNCSGGLDDVLTPTGTPTLLEAKAGTDALLSWSSIPIATHYDVVRGGLTALRSSGGDFATAIDQCATNNTFLNNLTASGVPASGNGFFYLVRGTVATCSAGTYDTGSARQVSSRDFGIVTAPITCP